MKIVSTRLVAAAALLTAAASSAFAQGVAYSSIPIYSNGYVVSVPNSPAGATTTYFPGSTGASTVPTSNFGASSNPWLYNPSLQYNVGPMPASAANFTAAATPFLTATPSTILGTVSNPYGAANRFPTSNGMPGSGNGFNPYQIQNNMSPYTQGWHSGFYPWK